MLAFPQIRQSWCCERNGAKFEFYVSSPFQTQTQVGVRAGPHGRSVAMSHAKRVDPKNSNPTRNETLCRTSILDQGRSLYIIFLYTPKLPIAPPHGAATCICSYFFTCCDICWYLFILFMVAHIYSYVVIFVDICSYSSIFMHMWWYLLICVDICWYLLISIDICSYMFYSYVVIFVYICS